VSGAAAQSAQNGRVGEPPAASTPATAATAAPTSAAAAEPTATEPPVVLQHFRPQDQRGLGVFEPPKDAGAPYQGFLLDWGAAFTQQFQMLDHSNAADPRLVDNVDAN